jgi:hypothetical protein
VGGGRRRPPTRSRTAQVSVYNACTLIWICTGPPLGPDIHANSDGYGVIAEAFAAVLGV